MHKEEIQVRQQLAGFLDGTIPLHQFRDWMRVQTWTMTAPVDWVGIQLVAGTEGRLAVFASGDFSTEQLQQSLASWVAAVDGQEPAGPDPLQSAVPTVRTVKAKPPV